MGLNKYHILKLSTYICALVILSFLFLFISNVPLSAKEWTTFGMDNTHSGVNFEDDVFVTSSYSWMRQMPAGAKQPVFNKSQVIVPASDGIYIYSKATGEKIASLKLSDIKNPGDTNPLIDSPAVSIADNLLYFTTFDGGIYRVNTENGEVLSQFMSGKKFGQSLPAIVLDAVGNTMVYCGLSEGVCVADKNLSQIRYFQAWYDNTYYLNISFYNSIIGIDKDNKNFSMNLTQHDLLQPQWGVVATGSVEEFLSHSTKTDATNIFPWGYIGAPDVWYPQNIGNMTYNVSYPPAPAMYGSDSYSISMFTFGDYKKIPEPALVRSATGSAVIKSWTKLPGNIMSNQMLCVDKGLIFLPLRGNSPAQTGIYCYDTSCSLKWFKQAILPETANVIKAVNFFVPGEDKKCEAVFVSMGLAESSGGDGKIKTIYALDPLTGKELWHSTDEVQAQAKALLQVSGSTLYYSDATSIRKYEGSEIGYSIKYTQDITDAGANLFTGNVIRSVTDADIPGKGLSFRLVRTYNSHSQDTGILGKGWTLNYEIKLLKRGTEKAADMEETVLLRGDGRKIIYNKVNGVFTPPSWETSKLEPDSTPDAGFILTERNGLKYKFYGFKEEKDNDYPLNGKLKEVRDIYNNVITFEYTSQGNLYRATDTGGRQIGFSFGTGKYLTSVTLPDNSTINYGRIDTNLTSVSGPGSISAQYNYYHKGMLTDYTEPRLGAGEKRRRYVYDDKNRVKEVKNANFSNMESFEYFPKEGKTIKIDAKNNKWEEFYNTNGQIFKIINPKKDYVQFWYDGYNKTAVRDEAGNITRIEYNVFGEVTKKTNAELQSESYVYDNYGNMTHGTDGNNKTTIYEYNKNSLLKVTNPKQEIVETNTYESNGLLKTKKDGENKEVEYIYDTYGNIDKIKDQYDREEDYDYNNMGRLTKFTDRNTKVTDYVYNPEGRVQTITKQSTGLGSYTKTHNYNILLNLASVSAPDGQYTYNYDADDRVISVTDAMNYSVISSYDANGNLKSIRDQNNKTTTYDYDVLNRQVYVLFPDGGNMTKEYYPNGLLKQINKPGEGVIAYEYDKAGRERKMTFPQKSVQKTYDDAGRLLTIVQGGVTQVNTYDNANRLEKIVYNQFKSMQYEYYLNGLVKKTKRDWDTSTESEVLYTYWDNGLLKESVATGTTSETRKFEYDNTGNRTKFEVIRGQVTESVNYEYDDFYRLKKVKDKENDEFVYTYNTSGTRASLTYPNGTKIEYSGYDAINRVGKISYVRNQIPQSPVILDEVGFAYDHINNVTQKTTLTETETYSYDNNYRLTGVNYGKTGESLGYEYDYNGRRLSTTENGQTTNYSYAGAGNEKLASVGADSYTYDAKGNVSKAGKNSYYHDEFNMLTEASNSETGAHVVYKYDIENRLKVRNEWNGKTNIFLYEGRDIFGEIETTTGDRLSSVYIRGINGELLKEKRYIKDENNQPVGVKYYYYPDRIGSVYMVCDEKGMPLEKETADPFSKGKTAGVSKFGLSSNMYDSVTGLYYFAARWYDPNTGRFLEMDPVLTEFGSVNMYDYCGNNPRNIVDRFGENWTDNYFDLEPGDPGYEESRKKFDEMYESLYGSKKEYSENDKAAGMVEYSAYKGAISVASEAAAKSIIKTGSTNWEYAIGGSLKVIPCALTIVTLGKELLDTAHNDNYLLSEKMVKGGYYIMFAVEEVLIESVIVAGTGPLYGKILFNSISSIGVELTKEVTFKRLGL